MTRRDLNSLKPLGTLLLCAAFQAVAGCAASVLYAFPEKAVIDVPAVKEAVEVETEINENSAAMAPEGTPWFAVIEGTLPIIVTAPHATKPFRENDYRFSDGGGTAAVAKMLNKLSAVTALVTTYASPSDPNYYDDNEFKKTLAALITEKRPILILDIHGSHAFRPYDVDLGTMNGDSLLGRTDLVKDLVSALQAEGLTNISYNYFAASKNQTITKFASARGVPSIQLEISSTWLTPSNGDLEAHRFAQLLQALVRFVEVQRKNQPEKSRH